MYIKHRTWFPFLFVGLTLALVLIIAVLFQPEESTEVVFGTLFSGEGAVEVSVVSEVEYQEMILGFFSDLDGGSDSVELYENLVDMTVPYDYKEVHLELVIYFGSVRDGRLAEAGARRDLLFATHAWLE
jgi:hypothetical protein